MELEGWKQDSKWNYNNAILHNMEITMLMSWLIRLGFGHNWGPSIFYWCDSPFHAWENKANCIESFPYYSWHHSKNQHKNSIPPFARSSIHSPRALFPLIYILSRVYCTPFMFYSFPRNSLSSKLYFVQVLLGYIPHSCSFLE